MNEWKKWMKIMKMVSQEEGNSLLTSQSKWKKIKPTGAILLANVFHIHYLFWAKPHPKTGAILWVSHENFTLTLIDPFSHTLFPNTKIRATFGSFCVFHTNLTKCISFDECVRNDMPNGYPNLLQILSKNFLPLTHL